MNVISIHHPYEAADIPTDDVVLVLGFFDGVHRGHQEVIAAGKQAAAQKGLKLAVMTFNHHPSIVFQKVDPDAMKYLSNVDRKIAIMESLGVDYLYVIEFTSAFAGLSPQRFVDEYMVGLHAKVVVAGFDYTYGPAAIADMPHLPAYARGRFEIIEVAKQNDLGKKISSTNIRHMMSEGDMENANHFLGYVYETSGTVVHGDARGRTLGFPTANIASEANVLLPKKGVYVVEINIADRWYHGMAQIGYNITFGANRRETVEVYILDFSEDIYGEFVTIRWHHFLRPEVKFDGAAGLIEQLQLDEQHTRDYFSKNN